MSKIVGTSWNGCHEYVEGLSVRSGSAQLRSATVMLHYRGALAGRTRHRPNHFKQILAYRGK